MPRCELQPDRHRLAFGVGTWQGDDQAAVRDSSRFGSQCVSAYSVAWALRHAAGGIPLRAAWALDSKQQARLSASITELLERLNRGGPRSLVVPGEYLEVVITKQ